ncbi:HU family DNA-binding protein [Cardinium endosymbiont of Culicoides punctatus]|uniref:HU family DNA-binding protein n=1 Tax=Cardinium endosymbiont of Culicoides punctatus TaxID=2304601 RepID=UPI0010CE8C80|nr:HU family DNA-binding protein [Cardinium endosymbiont of Culicoides punctatus]TDG94152.1 Integration host factor subunit alpha [Cardinium endosymbiont of Culicoides punctatus]
MTTSELILLVSIKTGLDKNNIRTIIDSLTDIIQDLVIEGQCVQFSSFGSFSRKKRVQEIGRNIL